MKKLGQHFLKDKSVANKVVAALKLGPNETVIEIGAGHGELTRGLLATSNKIQLVTIEKDEGLAKALAKNFQAPIYNFKTSMSLKNIGDEVSVVEGDALKILSQLTRQRKLEIGNWKLVGNIPYYITGHLLRTISELENKPSLCVLMLQREVAERIASAPPKMNRLAASVQFWAKPEILGYISKKKFKPAPKVDSSIIKLITRNTEKLNKDGGKKRVIGEKKYYAAMKMLFAQPRKTILNNLTPSGKKQKLDREEISKKLLKLNINPQDRPQNLSVEDIINISTRF